MARYTNRSNRYLKKHGSKISYGKPFKNKKGRYGCYKYVNGKRVAFCSTSGDFVFDEKWKRRY